MSENKREPQLSLSEQLRKLPESEVIRRLREEYHRTGTYRIEDLYQILGDPGRVITIQTQGQLTPGNLLF